MSNRTKTANHENARQRKHKATCWRVRMIRAWCHKTEHEKKKHPKKQILYPCRAKPDGTRLTLCQRSQHNFTSHKIWNKRKQLSDCSRFNAWHRVHGQNHANIHLFRVSGTETGRGGKQWLNVFVTESQKLIAGYLHSRDHTQRSLLNGENHIVIKDIVLKGAGCVLESRRYCSIPLSMKGLLWALVLSLRPCLLAQNYTYFSAPWGLVLNCCFQS